MRVGGIDPGVTGALAVFSDEGKLEEVIDLPTIGKFVFGHQLKGWLLNYRLDHVFIEDLHAMPVKGSKAAFSQGYTLGTIITATQCAHVPFTTVMPSAWKAHHSLVRRGATDRERKEASRLRAVQLWPHVDYFNRKMDHNRAEAALIGAYGHELLA